MNSVKMSVSAILQNLRCIPIKSSLTRTCVRLYSAKAPRQGAIKEVDPVTGESRTKKTDIIPKITLLSGESVSVTTLQEAEKIAKRRDLKLVRILDPEIKSQRPVYKLMSGAEYHAEDLRRREEKKRIRETLSKGEKVLLINAKIAQHDLDTQLRRAIKWLKRMYEVRIVISGASGNVESSEKVFSSIEQYLKNEDADLKITQKRIRGADIKGQIIPPGQEQSRDL